jgi:hypothetical protein
MSADAAHAGAGCRALQDAAAAASVVEHHVLQADVAAAELHGFLQASCCVLLMHRRLK